MNMSTKVRCKLPLIALALVFAAGLSFATFSNTSQPATVHDSSALSAQMNVLERNLQSGIAALNEEEPEDTLGPAIAIGMLVAGFVLGGLAIYQCRKDDTDPQRYRELKQRNCQTITGKAR